MMLEKVSFRCANFTALRGRLSCMFLTIGNMKFGDDGKVLLCVHGGKSSISVDTQNTK